MALDLLHERALIDGIVSARVDPPPHHHHYKKTEKNRQTSTTKYWHKHVSKLKASNSISMNMLPEMTEQLQHTDLKNWREKNNTFVLLFKFVELITKMQDLFHLTVGIDLFILYNGQLIQISTQSNLSRQHFWMYFISLHMLKQICRNIKICKAKANVCPPSCWCKQKHKANGLMQPAAWLTSVRHFLTKLLFVTAGFSQCPGWLKV